MGIEYGERRSTFIDYGRPSLFLDFARRKSLIDSMSETNLITFTRSSTGTYVGSDGLIKTAAADEPRFDHDPETGESLGLLIEDQSTNLIIQSNSFFTSPWTGYSSARTTNGSPILSPDGNINGRSIVSNTTIGAVFFDRAYPITSTNGISYTFSIFLKANPNTSNYASICLNENTNPNLNDDWSTFELTGSGTIVRSQINQNAFNTTIQNYGNGWYKCSVSAIGTGATLYGRFQVSSAGNISSSSSLSWVQGDILLYAYGAQIEQASFPTSYIPTSGSTVTRNADTAEITGTNFTDWYSPNPQTWFINYDTPYVVKNIHNPTILNLGNISYIQDIAIRVQDNNQILFWEDGTPTTFIVSTFTGQNCLDCKYAIAVDLPGGNLTQSVNGLSDYRTFTAEPFKNSTRMFLGNATGSSFKYLNGHLKQLLYYPTRLTNTQLQALTQ